MGKLSSDASCRSSVTELQRPCADRCPPAVFAPVSQGARPGLGPCANVSGANAKVELCNTQSSRTGSGGKPELTSENRSSVCKLTAHAQRLFCVWQVESRLVFSRQIPRGRPLSEIRKELKMEIEALEVVSGTLPPRESRVPACGHVAMTYAAHVARLNVVTQQRGSQCCLGKSPS
jgi:hypothetical protein